MKENDPIMTTQQVADYFKVSTRTVMRRVKDGSLKRCKIGRLVRFKASDVEALIGANDGGNDREKSSDAKAIG